MIEMVSKIMVREEKTHDMELYPMMPAVER